MFDDVSSYLSASPNKKPATSSCTTPQSQGKASAAQRQGASAEAGTSRQATLGSVSSTARPGITVRPTQPMTGQADSTEPFPSDPDVLAFDDADDKFLTNVGHAGPPQFETQVTAVGVEAPPHVYPLQLGQQHHLLSDTNEPHEQQQKTTRHQARMPCSVERKSEAVAVGLAFPGPGHRLKSQVDGQS